MERATEQEIRQRLKMGQEYPFDGTDEWWQQNQDADPKTEAPADKLDWAVRAARGVIADLCDRRAIKNGFDDIEADTRREIVETMAAIIRFAAEQK